MWGRYESERVDRGHIMTYNKLYKQEYYEVLDKLVLNLLTVKGRFHTQQAYEMLEQHYRKKEKYAI